MTAELIIFDCDGVLVDSELISCRVHAEIITRHGYPISAEQVAARFLGRSGRDAQCEIEAELGRALGDRLEAELRDELLRGFAESLEPVAFVAAALGAIRQPVCVASSGSLERIAAALRRTGLYQRFAPHLFSAEQVRRGKPAPDLFLLAAERMGVAPSRCVVIEDSVPGIAGARAAGMTVLGFSGGSHCGPGSAAALAAAGAARTFADMRQLPGIIDEMGMASGAGRRLTRRLGWILPAFAYRSAARDSAPSLGSDTTDAWPRRASCTSSHTVVR